MTEQAPPTTPASMRAIVQDEYGSADVLQLTDRPVPEAGDDEVLVRVHAAGLDRGTWHLMAGLPYLIRPAYGFRGPRQPIAGIDLAGTVVAVGADVSRFGPGDEVYGTGSGTFAEYAVTSESKLSRKPTNINFEQAAAVPVSALTALQGLTDVGHVAAGQRVLIIGASGGVGSYAVQLAKVFGAEVTAVSSTSKVDVVRSLGADHVIDYTRDDFADGSTQYDLILDIAGNTRLSKLRSALTEKGTLVIVGGEEGGRWIGGIDRNLRALALSPFISQRLTMFVSKETHVDLQRLTEFIESGDLTPSVDSVVPLADAPDAMRRLEAGEVRGKTVISIADES
ncbi:MAG: NAD(P)-dependent alcohol dehydrogenase [Acidimicrobiia bacterium]|nr:NAD(P)-dependent alcohol dehydrogenase [Acidimicrobiia bacterium]